MGGPASHAGSAQLGSSMHPRSAAWNLLRDFAHGTPQPQQPTRCGAFIGAGFFAGCTAARVELNPSRGNFLLADPERCPVLLAKRSRPARLAGEWRPGSTLRARLYPWARPRRFRRSGSPSRWLHWPMRQQTSPRSARAREKLRTARSRVRGAASRSRSRQSTSPGSRPRSTLRTVVPVSAERRRSSSRWRWLCASAPSCRCSPRGDARRPGWPRSSQRQWSCRVPRC